MQIATVVIALVIGGLLLLFFFGNWVSLIVTLLVWALIGNIAGRIMNGKGYDILTSIGLGLVGGIVGSILIRVVGLGAIANIPLIGGIVVGIIGAVIVVLLMRLFNPKFGR